MALMTGSSRRPGRPEGGGSGAPIDVMNGGTGRPEAGGAPGRRWIKRARGGRPHRSRTRRDHGKSKRLVRRELIRSPVQVMAAGVAHVLSFLVLGPAGRTAQRALPFHDEMSAVTGPADGHVVIVLRVAFDALLHADEVVIAGTSNLWGRACAGGTRCPGRWPPGRPRRTPGPRTPRCSCSPLPSSPWLPGSPGPA